MTFFSMMNFLVVMFCSLLFKAVNAGGPYADPCPYNPVSYPATPAETCPWPPSPNQTDYGEGDGNGVFFQACMVWAGSEVSKQTGCTIYKEGFEYRSSVSGCTICVSDLTSATTTDAVEADLASTFENRNRCLSERRLDGVDPKKSIVPSGTILLEGCQRRTASGMIPKSYADTRDLFRNQVDEQTTARLGDTQQRKTTISTMMVDNCLSEEILEVRLEHTPRAIYHALL